MVTAERARQDAKWGVWDNAPERWYAILAEEVGEAYAEQSVPNRARDTCVITLGVIARTLLYRQLGRPLQVQLHTFYRQAEHAYITAQAGAERAEWVQVGAVTRAWLEHLDQGTRARDAQ